MKSLARNILAFCMAWVVLCSTMSFTVDMHYCGDTLVDVAFYKEAKSCGMELMPKQLQKSSITKKGCCTDHKVVVKGQKELKQAVNDVTLQQQLFVTAFVYAYNQLFEIVPEHTNTFNVFQPPKLTLNRQVQYQIFLI